MFLFFLLTFISHVKYFELDAKTQYSRILATVPCACRLANKKRAGFGLLLLLTQVSSAIVSQTPLDDSSDEFLYQ